ncbi:hypothetical protein HPB52_022562 [Rhipicephalus sanguineus]|uniref:Uncharacterized protein n=1 Tax=Rhipicephalus sanguineus TaxID=34632 RepID=A0A9D4PHE5_RHISA|nr:hypothetical protein HPB52_022562 [Rhipicephalus sanguineus]
MDDKQTGTSAVEEHEERCTLKFPNYPSYMSRKTARREDPDSKCARIENAALQKAIAESNEAFNRAREEDKVNSLSKLANHLRSQEMKFWDVIERNERILLIHTVDDEAPWLKYSVCVKADLSVKLHFMKTAVKKLGANLCVPEIANSEWGMVELLEGIEKWDGDLGQKFAQLEDKILLAQILRRFTVQSMIPNEDLQMSLELVLRPTQGLHVKFTPRDRMAA